MKRALHFTTKLNSRDIQKCDCFCVPSHDLFASARKAVFPAPTATGVHRLRNTWSSLPSQRLVGGVVWGRSNLPQKRSTVLSESKFGAPKSKIPESAPEFPPRQRSSATYRLAASKLFILAARELYARGEALPLAWCSLANGSSNYRKAFPDYRRLFFLVHGMLRAVGWR